jgi:hypothetical protein
MGKMRHAYKILVWKPLGKHQLGRQRKQECNITTNLKDIYSEASKWMELA